MFWNLAYGMVWLRDQTPLKWWLFLKIYLGPNQSIEREWKEGFFTKEKAKNTLRSFTFSYLDLDLEQYFTDRKKIRILKTITETFSILKPDKGNGVVVMKRSEWLYQLC